MSNPGPILVYGRDSRLLDTRHLLLETLGGKVYEAADREMAERLLVQLEPAVLVLCYTLESEERDLITSFVKVTCPTTKVLVLQADGPASTQTDEEFSIYTGPAAFIARVAEMIAVSK